MQQTSSEPGAKTGSRNARKEIPPGSKPAPSDEPRAGRFSFGWLFRRDGEGGRPSSPDAGKRKSHDASAKEAKISYSSSFFQQLYARTAKSSSVAFCDPSKSLDLSKHLCGMRSSFSSSDVQQYCHVTPPLPISSSTYDARAKPEKVVLAMPPDERSPSTVACRLCLSLVDVRDMVSLEDCGCRFCWQCLRQYLSVNIREGNVVLACPESHCRGKIGMAEIEKLVDGDVLDMFKRFKANREVEMDPTRTWCPMPGCSTVCHVRPAPSPDRGTPVFCPSCGFTFCSSCKIRWHATKTCDQVRKELRDEKEFPVSDEESSPIKRCPFCRIPIERDEGCAQMMCKNCKHVFCWYCLASLDDDFLLRHYDKGPCKNRLGHSRASVVWHRTQVVGIFAGFGFLLLIASPFLLLAAPCLLCCKCNKCFKAFEQQDPPHAADP